MDENQFLTAIIAGLIIARVMHRGRQFHADELAGKATKGYDFWLFSWIGVGVGITYLGQTMPFFWSLQMDLIGLFLAFNAYYWATVAVRRLRQHHSR
jgi:hypothetical protein